MLTAFGMARIGRDAEIRSTPSGDSVIQLSLAFNIFVKKEKTTQWIEAAIWGARAESLQPYLLKGKAVSVVLENLHEEKFTKGDGTPSSKLVARIAEIDLAPSGEGQQSTRAPAAAPAPRPAQQRPAPQKSAPTGFDDMDDDIPFILSLNEYTVSPPKVRRMSRTKF